MLHRLGPWEPRAGPRFSQHPRRLGRALSWHLGVLGLRMRLGQSWVLRVKRGLKSQTTHYLHPLHTPTCLAQLCLELWAIVLLPTLGYRAASLCSPRGEWGSRLHSPSPSGQHWGHPRHLFPSHPIQTQGNPWALPPSHIQKPPLLTSSSCHLGGAPILAHLTWCGCNFSLSQIFQKFPSSSGKKKKSQSPTGSFAITEPFSCSRPPQLHLLSIQHPGLLTDPGALRLMGLPCSLLSRSVLCAPSLPFKRTPWLLPGPCTLSPWQSSFQENGMFTVVARLSWLQCQLQGRCLCFVLSCVPSA